MYKGLRRYLDRLETRVRGFLSHYPIAYGLIVGIGIVLFWRGVWHSVDSLHIFYTHVLTKQSTTDLAAMPWWDGPLSFIIGGAILLFGGAFVSSFIGNEIIISGLRGEKRLTQQTESEMRHEVGAIADIKAEVKALSEHLRHLEDKLK